MDNSKEIFPIVDANGNVTGKITRGEAHNGSRILHPVVHMHVFNKQGDLYLQKRPEWKDIQPGKWDTATGGHVDYGEDIPTAIKREVNEELGIAVDNYKSLGYYVYDSKKERELVYVNNSSVSSLLLNDGEYVSAKVLLLDSEHIRMALTEIAG